MYSASWTKGYEFLVSQDNKRAVNPIIGITGNFEDKKCSIAQGYFRSVLEAGMVPLIIPPLTDAQQVLSVLSVVDGLLLSGGGDVNPLLVGQEPIPSLHSINPQRDAYELLLIRLAYDRQIPMLGICRGIQLLNIALGGNIYQDLGDEYPNSKVLIKHCQDLERGFPSHSVSVDTKTTLYSIFKSEHLYVNSFHHQAVSDVSDKLMVSARSKDGVVEAVESTEFKSIIGVQWHPECFIEEGDRAMMPLFGWLRNEAASFSAAKALHKSILTLDSHCDTPMFFDKGINFRHRDDLLCVDSHKMSEGMLDASIMVAYLPQGERTEEGLKQAVVQAKDTLSRLENMITDCPDFSIARTPDELYSLKKENKHAVMMGIENGYAIGNDISLIEYFRSRGVVYLTLCHNGDNDICDSARGNNEHGGVSEFGKNVIKEMNRTGMMVDLSHASEKSFYDALELSSNPIVCSHSSSKKLCDHPRNLSDEQLRALADSGGVAQVTFYHGFLSSQGEATVLDALYHLNHMVEVAGIDHVGIGTDFDGDGGIRGCASAAELINFTRLLISQGYSSEDIEKIWGGNFLRVMRQCQQRSGF